MQSQSYPFLTHPTRGKAPLPALAPITQQQPEPLGPCPAPPPQCTPLCSAECLVVFGWKALTKAWDNGTRRALFSHFADALEPQARKVSGSREA